MLLIKNITKQEQVFQIKMENSAEGFEGSHQTIMEYPGEGGEKKVVRKRVLRHGPVIRIRSGCELEVPACIVRDPSISGAIQRNELRLIRVEDAPAPKKSKSPETDDSDNSDKPEVPVVPEVLNGNSADLKKPHTNPKSKKNKG